MSESTILGVPFQPGPYVLAEDSQVHAGVPRGVVSARTWRSRIYEGTERTWHVCVMGDGADDRIRGGVILPDSLRWLWRK